MTRRPADDASACCLAVLLGPSLVLVGAALVVDAEDAPQSADGPAALRAVVAFDALNVASVLVLDATPSGHDAAHPTPAARVAGGGAPAPADLPLQLGGEGATGLRRSGSACSDWRGSVPTGFIPTASGEMEVPARALRGVAGPSVLLRYCIDGVNGRLLLAHAPRYVEAERLVVLASPEASPERLWISLPGLDRDAATGYCLRGISGAGTDAVPILSRCLAVAAGASGTWSIEAPSADSRAALAVTRWPLPDRPLASDA